MRKLSDLSLTVKINKPVEVVWKSLVDWHSQGEWMLQTKVWSELDQDRTVKNGKGVLIFAFTGLFPKQYPKLRLGVLDTMEITMAATITLRSCSYWRSHTWQWKI